MRRPLTQPRRDPTGETLVRPDLDMTAKNSGVAVAAPSYRASLRLHTSALEQRRKWLRRVHALVGVVLGANLLLLLLTGFLLQHREVFRLDERVVSRRLLPSGYRPQDGPEGVRADIVAADLHSGRVLGRTGALILDGITLGWVVLLLTGVVIYGAGLRQRESLPGNGNGKGSREELKRAARG